MLNDDASPIAALGEISSILGMKSSSLLLRTFSYMDVFCRERLEIYWKDRSYDISFILSCLVSEIKKFPKSVRSIFK